MAYNAAPFCTDEEILLELKKLGYNDIPADAFLMMKKDLSELVLKDQSISLTSLSQNQRSTVRDTKYPNHTPSFNQGIAFLPTKSPTFIVDAKAKEKAPSDYLYHPSEISVENNSFSKHSNGLKNSNRPLRRKKLPEDSSEDSDISSDALKDENSHTGSDVFVDGTTSFNEYKERLKNFKAGRQSKSIDLNLVENGESSLNSSSVSLEGNKIKRKVLRHKNGKPVITEEFLELPSIFNTSYPETENSDATPKSISSDELSFKSNSSSGSISVASPDSSETPRSTVSMSSTRGSQSRVSNQRKKKSDPVAMYNYYKKFWNDFKPPGEKTHDKLRWAVRDRMLDYSL